jgi:hypothetical protein
MKMKKATLAIAILGCLVAAPVARAAAPQLVPVQGVLTDSAGTPIDTSVTTVFSIYASEVGGTALWTETQDVLVEDGLFTAYLGDVTALDLATFRDNGDLWLGVQVGSDAEMPRMYLGSGPFAGYAEYCGAAPAPDFADITGTIDPTDLPTGLVTGPLACTGTEKVSGVDSSGALVCAADEDTDTTYTAGTGLILSGTMFSADTATLQTRVSGSCPSGQSIRAINGDGTVACEVDDDTNTTYTAGTGLTLTGTTFSANETYLQRRVTGTCPAGQSIRAIGSTGTVTCEVDDTGGTGDITGVTAGIGLSGGGTSGTVTLDGAISAADTGGGTTTIGTSCTTYDADVTVSASGPGYVILSGDMWVRGTRTVATTDYMYAFIGESTTDCGWHFNEHYPSVQYWPASWGTGTIHLSMPVNARYRVTSSGSYTYSINMYRASGSNTYAMYYATLTAIFIPD